MLWDRIQRSREGGRPAIGARSFNINEQCFIRKAYKCGKIDGASKSCFIACPTHDELEPILDLMSEKLTKYGIEPVIAVKDRAYGQDIFCTKICGKIIESMFCIAILDDTVSNELTIPNPNVYYEYGLMTALRKHIIPLQKENLELAFNIQSFDTVKYNSRNIGRELDRAIKDAIRIVEFTGQEEKGVVSYSDNTIKRNLEISGFVIRDSNWFLWDSINDTSYIGVSNYEEKLWAFIAKVDDAHEVQACIEDLSVIVYRTERTLSKTIETLSDLQDKLDLLGKRKLDEKVRKDDQKTPWLRNVNITNISNDISKVKQEINRLKPVHELSKKIYIGFILSPAIDISSLLKNVKSLIEKYERYEVVFSINDQISFGAISVPLKTVLD